MSLGGSAWNKQFFIRKEDCEKLYIREKTYLKLLKKKSHWINIAIVKYVYRICSQLLPLIKYKLYVHFLFVFIGRLFENGAKIQRYRDVKIDAVMFHIESKVLFFKTFFIRLRKQLQIFVNAEIIYIMFAYILSYTC